MTMKHLKTKKNTRKKYTHDDGYDCCARKATNDISMQIN